MGGADKGALKAPDRDLSIIERQVQLARDMQLECVLLGAREAWKTRLPSVRILPDQPKNVGPLGGLAALLQDAGARPAITLACDMPFIDQALLQQLVRSQSAAPVVAPRDPETGKWQPLFARYRSAAVLPALLDCLREGLSSFQPLLHKMHASELVLDGHERRKLRDWDTPQDVRNEGHL